MARASVAVDVATSRTLPLVSIRSGDVADGFVTLEVDGHLLHLPLTGAEFQRVRFLRRRARSARWGGALCLAIGLAMARFPLMLPLGVMIAGLSLLLWAVTRLAIRTYLPSVEVVGSDVRLRRVHGRFAAALAADC